MAAKSGSVDYWRQIFRSTGSDIFELIEQAILVAAVDFPKEFKDKKGRIAEKLFNCRFTRCFGCNHMEVRVPDDGEDMGEEEGGGSVKREVGEKGSKVDSNNGEHEELKWVGLSNSNYDEAEGLTNEMDEKCQIVSEVLRLKEVITHEKSDSVLYESLGQLQLMQLTVDTLKETAIGRAVNGLRKHNSKQIRNLVRTLIEAWKVLVDEWVNSEAALLEHSPDSAAHPAMADEDDGLPSPPMDEGTLLAAQTTTMELSEFFDGMDDDGNIKTSMDTGRPENRGPVRRQEQSEQLCTIRQAKPHSVPNTHSKPQGNDNKNSKGLAAVSGSGRPIELSAASRQISAVQRKPSGCTQDKPSNPEEVSDCAKLELAKRKLHEGYRQAENAKRQRTIQVMELHDLPKQSHNRGPIVKPKGQVKPWSNSRR